MTDIRPQKRIRSADASNANISDAADSDDNIVMAAPLQPPAHKRGRRIVIALAINPTPPTERLNSNNLTRQGTFEDMSWQTRRLQTDDEKKAEWSKDAEEMQEEREADRIHEAADRMDRAQRKKDLARERQRRHRALVKKQNPKPKRLVNDVRSCMHFICLADSYTGST